MQKNHGSYQSKKNYHTIQKVFFCLVVVISMICIGGYLGFIPGTFPRLEVVVQAGSIKSIASNKSFLDLFDHFTLIPYEGYLNELFGMLFIGKIISFFFHDSLMVVNITLFIIYIIGFISFVYLLYRVSYSKVIAILIAPLYFLSPVSNTQVSPVLFGWIVFPFSLIADYLIFTKIFSVAGFFHNFSRIYFLRCFILIIVTILIRVFVSSFSWYMTFIMAFVSCAFFGIRFLLMIKEKGKFEYLLKYLIFVIIPWVVGMIAILTITPSSAGTFSSPPEFFNGSSLSLITAFFPSGSELVSKILPTYNAFIPEGQKLSGDGTMWKNYIGYILLFCSIMVFFRKNTRNKNTIAIIIVCFFTLILSMGRGIKFRGVIDSSIPFLNHDMYLLPDDQIILFPWENIFSYFPLNSMRAIYRWSLGYKPLLIILAAIFLGDLWKSKRKVNCYFALIIGFSGILEIFPISFLQSGFSESQNIYQKAVEIRDQTIFSIKDKINEKSTVAITTYDYDTNAFLSSFIFPELSAYTYSGSGDKNMVMANEYTPKNILQFQRSAEPNKLAYEITNINEKGLADYIIFPFFALRENIYSWPPSEETKSYTKEIAYQTVKILGENYSPIETENYLILDSRHLASESMYDRAVIVPEEIEDFSIISEEHILSSDKAVLIDTNAQLIRNLVVPEGDDALYIQLYARSLKSSENALLRITIQQLRENGEIITTDSINISFINEYKLFEEDLPLKANSKTIKIIIESGSNEKIVMKKALFQSFDLDKIHTPDVSFAPDHKIQTIFTDFTINFSKEENSEIFTLSGWYE